MNQANPPSKHQSNHRRCVHDDKLATAEEDGKKKSNEHASAIRQSLKKRDYCPAVINKDQMTIQSLRLVVISSLLSTPTVPIPTAIIRAICFPYENHTRLQKRQANPKTEKTSVAC